MPHRKFLGKNNTRAVSKILVAAIVVIVVVAVGVGAYLATRGTGTSPSPSPSASSTPTPGTTNSATPTAAISTTSSASSTPKPSTTAAPTTAPTTAPGGIAKATSYEFNETGTAANGTQLDTVFYAAKNLGTSNVEFIDVVTTPQGGTFEYIVNGAQQKAWAYSGGQWIDFSTEYATQLSTVQSTAAAYTNMLTTWGGTGSFTYTIPAGQPNAGDTATFTNIQINPNLPDSLFQPPS
jgi:cytoskeletal protein RodZ